MNGTAKSRVPKGEAPARFLGDRGPGLGLVCAGSGARQRSNGDSVSERLKRPRPSAPRKEMAPGDYPEPMRPLDGGSGDGAPRAHNPSVAVRGQPVSDGGHTPALYRNKAAGCHGPDGFAVLPIDLVRDLLSGQSLL
jgi:hypothetical protein